MAELTANQKSLVGYMTRSAQHAAHGFNLILKSPHPESFFDELRGAGLFDPARNPKPQPVEGNEGFFRIPVWTALNYLKRAADIAGSAGDVALGNKVMDVMRAIASYRDNDAVVDNYHTFSDIADILGKVPPSCVTLADIDYAELLLSTRWSNSSIVPDLDHAMKSFLASPNPDDHAKAVRLLEHCTKLKEAEPEESSRKLATMADVYWLELLLEHNTKKLGELGKAPAMDCLRARLSQLFSKDYISTHSWIWRAAIEEHQQNHDWDHVTNAFVEALRDGLEAWIESDPASAQQYVADLLQDQSQINRRIAINAIRTHWASLSPVFEQGINAELFEIGHLHELYLLLREHFLQMKPESQERVVALILGIDDGLEAESEELQRARYRQRNWLDAIKGLGNQTVDEAYRRLTEAFGPIREYPDFLSYHSTWVGSGPSPFSEDELVAFAEDKTLIQRVESFVPPRDERRGSRKSLIDGVSEAIQSHPYKFLWMLDTAVAMNRRTQYAVINGYAKALESKDSGDTTVIRRVLDTYLPYISSTVADTAFWEEPVEESEDFEPNRDWIPPVVVGIAKKLVANDNVQLTETDFRNLFDAFRNVQANSEGIKPSDDPMTAAINNPRGVAVEAMLQFILRRCRESDKSKGDHKEEWDGLQGSLDEELSRCKDGHALESSTLFASYLAQLMYADPRWVTDNAARIFPFDHPANVLAALAGLSFANATPQVYAVLKQADIPRRALNLNELEGSARERLIERIALAYIWGDEALDSLVISEMFSDSRLDDLMELASTVARWSDETLKPEQTSRAKDLAKALVEFGAHEPVARKRILAAASRFIGFVRQPADDDMPWLLSVAPYAHGSHGDDDFLEALDKIVAEDAQRALEIFEVFMRDYTLGYDYRDRLQGLIRKLDSAGFHAPAIAVVNELVKSGGGPKWVELYKELVGKAPPPPPPPPPKALSNTRNG